MVTEEFSSWIGSIDAYRDGAGAKSRGDWLLLFDGGPYRINRIKRGSFLVLELGRIGARGMHAGRTQESPKAAPG